MKNAAFAFVILISALWSVVACGGQETTFALYVRAAETQFQELDLHDKLYNHLLRYPVLDLAVPGEVDSVFSENPEFVGRHFRPERMTNAASMLGSRYLVWISIEEAGIKESEHTIIPYLFKSHHRHCVLGVRMFVVDSHTQETVATQFYESKKKLADAMSSLDFDSNDPGLFKKYSIVKGKFDELEAEISEKIIGELLTFSDKR